MTKLSALLVCLFLYLFLAQSVVASVLVKQTDQYSDTLNVYQSIQELGDNLSGVAKTFTFRVNTTGSNLNYFDYTAQNSKIYDKTTNSLVASGCVPFGFEPNNQLRGLTFNTNGVPQGYQDVTIDFSCRSFQFIPGHRYLILITNANRCDGCIKFASAAYATSGQDYFTGGGVRYANGNPFDYSHNSGSCDPIAYIWNDLNPTPRSGCNIFSTPKDDLYFILSDTTPEPTPTPSPTPTPTPTPSPTPQPKTPLILIPGIGGSELKTNEDTFWSKDDGHGGVYSRTYAKNEVVWLNEPEARAAGEDDYFDILRMKTDGVNSEADIALTSSFISSYQEFITFFAANGYTLNQDLFVFPYDWRRDISITASLLDDKIQTIKQQTDSQNVDIVTHSMGGLVARNYISDFQRAQNVRKLFTLGTPYLGTVESLKTIAYGGCLTTLTSLAQFLCLGIPPSEVKDVFQNMISGFELAPSQSYFNFYTGEDNQHPYPYRTESGALSYNQIKSLLTNLGHNTALFTPSETFHSMDNTLSNTNGVEVTVIAGSGKSTLGQIIEQKTTSLLGIPGIHKDVINMNGDNTVPLFSASLNDPAKDRSLLGLAKVYYTNQEHSQLVSIGSALNLVMNILEGIGDLPTGVSLNPYSFRGTSLSVHSPVNIHVYDANSNHTGPTSDGFEANIPDSSYDTLDDAKFIFLPEEGVYNINFEARDNGSFDFKIRKFENDENINTVLYNNIPIISSSQGQTIFDTNSPESPNLLIDGQIITPDAILTGDENYDFTPPIININTPQRDQTLTLNQPVSADFQCLDENSGVDQCIGSTNLGENLDTATVGNKSFRVFSEDKAGNSADLINNFKVQYLSSGLCLSQTGHTVLQPINTDGTSVFKQGSTIPVKFRVCDSSGTSIATSGVVSGFSLIKVVSGTAVSTINEPVLSTTAESSFRWDPTNQQWIFNMSTKTLSAGKTYFYKISLNDETSIEFSFGLR